MKILLVDTESSGHHVSYLNNILSIQQRNIDFSVVVPPGFPQKKHYFELPFPSKENSIQYLYDREKWLISLATFARDLKPDIIHFLYGDAIYQLGGVGFHRIKNITANLVMTQHHLPVGKIRSVCFRYTAKMLRKIVVHTAALKNSLVNLEIENKKIEVIDYPTSHSVKMSQEEAKRKLGLNMDQKILLALGGTRYGKGLDILLEASKLVQRDFCLVIAGKEEDFKGHFIKSKSEKIPHNIIIRLGKLSDDEFSWYLDAADCIVLPYRKSFDGASGPMTEAIWRRKPVIAPSHGSLGNLVNKYNLGYSFESENVKDLAKKIQKFLAVTGSFYWTPKAESFRADISPEAFAAKYLDLYNNLGSNQL